MRKEIPLHFKLALPILILGIAGFASQKALSKDAKAAVEREFKTVSNAISIKANDLIAGVAGPTETEIIAVGDMMLGRTVATRVHKYNDPNWPFLETRDVISEADIALVNLESPFGKDCFLSDKNILVFCAPVAEAIAVRDAGFDVINTTNNHSLDQGKVGYDLTLSAIRENGMKPSDENNFVVIKRGKTKFGFVGFNRIPQGSVIPWQENEILSRVQSLDREVDVLIVSTHWGDEDFTVHDSEQEELAHKLIDAGADLVIGTHPHVTQDIEEYKGKLIFYSLGNYVFDQNGYLNNHSNVVRFKFIGAELVSRELLPIEIKDYGQPRFISEDN